MCPLRLPHHLDSTRIWERHRRSGQPSPTAMCGQDSRRPCSTYSAPAGASQYWTPTVPRTKRRSPRTLPAWGSPQKRLTHPQNRLRTARGRSSLRLNLPGPSTDACTCPARSSPLSLRHARQQSRRLSGPSRLIQLAWHDPRPSLFVGKPHPQLLIHR